MTFKTILLATALLLPATFASAQGTAPAELKTLASSAEIQALIAKAKATPPRPLVSQPIIGANGYRAALEYRVGAPAPASIHDNEGELMVVVEGSGTLTTGGTLVEPTRPNPANQAGSSIAGGTPLHLAKGDMTIVPAGVAHQIAGDAGSAIVLMTFHVPVPWPGK